MGVGSGVLGFEVVRGVLGVCRARVLLGFSEGLDICGRKGFCWVLRFLLFNTAFRLF